MRLRIVRVLLVATGVLFVGSGVVAQQQLPMDPLTAWGYLEYQSQNLAEIVDLSHVFVVVEKDLDRDAIAELTRRYQLTEVPSGLTAEHPEVHRRLFVKDLRDFAGFGVLLAFNDPPTTDVELFNRIAAVQQDERVVFSSPVFDRNGQSFALTPYAVVTWNDLLEVTNLAQALKPRGFQLVRPPTTEESSVLVRLDPAYRNILAAMLLVHNDRYFDDDSNKTYPIIVRLLPPIDIQWKMRPRGVDELSGSPVALTGQPQEFVIWATLAPGVELPEEQFFSAIDRAQTNDERNVAASVLLADGQILPEGSFLERFQIGVLPEGKTELLYLQKNPVFWGGHAPLEVGQIVLRQENRDDGSSEVTIIVPFVAYPPGEYWLDRLSLRVRATSPLTSETTQFVFERHYDEPDSVIGFLHADAPDGGAVSPRYGMADFPDRIVGSRWPLFLLGAGGAWLVGLLTINVIVPYVARRMLKREPPSESESDRWLREFNEICIRVNRAASDEEVWIAIQEQIRPAIARTLFEDEGVFGRGRTSISKIIGRSDLSADLKDPLAGLLEDARTFTLTGSIPSRTRREILETLGLFADWKMKMRGGS